MLPQPLYILVLLTSVASASLLRASPHRLMRWSSAIVAGCLMLPVSPLLADDVDDEITMRPQVVQEAPRAPQSVEVRSISPSAQRQSEEDPSSYQSSLQRERQKQEDRRRARASDKYRSDLCESLGRGC